jgi:hypothetical protein
VKKIMKVIPLMLTLALSGSPNLSSVEAKLPAKDSALRNSMETHQTSTVTFVGTVESIELLGKRKLTVIAIDSDPRFVVTVNLESVTPRDAPLKEGRAMFAIHSPARLFRSQIEAVIGKQYLFRVTWQKLNDGARFSQLTATAIAREKRRNDIETAKLPNEYNQLPEQLRKQATIVLSGKYWEGRSPCIWLGDGRRVWAMESGFAVDRVYQGHVGGKSIQIKRAALRKSDYFGQSLVAQRRYLVLLRPDRESNELIKSGKIMSFSDALHDDEIIAIVQLN